MKKLSNKQRKLRYIREKNHYRLGGKGSFFFKISREMIQDTEFIESWTKEEMTKNLNKLNRKFKMEFEVFSICMGACENDILYDLTTILMYFKRIVIK